MTKPLITLLIKGLLVVLFSYSKFQLPNSGVDVKAKGVLIRRVKLEDDGRMKLISHRERRKQPWKDVKVIENENDQPTPHTHRGQPY